MAMRSRTGQHRVRKHRETTSMATARRILLAASWLCVHAAPALDGDPGMHDPATVIEERGRYYSYGTGQGLPISISEDGWTWRRAGAVFDAVAGGRPGEAVLARGGNNTWAPDLIRSGDRYFLYYSAPGQQPRSAIGLLIGKTLDPNGRDYGWVDGGPVVWSDGVEDCNAIDPGVFRDPSDGRLWLSYGSYFGFIRLVELDPATGQRRHPESQATDIAINGEASIIIHRDGWYYLLLTHGSCCRGAASTYNIRVGRARSVQGPYLDSMGIALLQGGGKLFLGAGGRRIGPGHFGLLDSGDGVQKFSLHYEADLAQGGRSVLDIRPLLWRDGWPVAGDHFVPGSYAIESQRTGTVLELSVEGVPVGGPRRPGPMAGDAAQVVPDQDVRGVSANWPADDVAVRLSPYLLQAQQRWSVQPIAGDGGVPGEPWFRISIAGTERTLAVTAGGELITVPAFTGAPEQLWRLDQLADGSWRIAPRATQHLKDRRALSAAGSSSVSLDPYDPASDRQRWRFNAP